MRNNLKLIKYILISLALVFVIFISGAYIGYKKHPNIDNIVSAANKNQEFEIDADFDLFWKAWKILNEKSIYAKEVTDQEKVWGAIQGLAQSLGDPHTIFFPPEESKLFKEEIEGSFEGIGAEIDVRDGVLTIVAPLKNTPAWKAGLKPGDKIIEIDGISTENMDADRAVSLMRGPKGTELSLKIISKDELEVKNIIVIRDVIDYPIIETELRDDNIFVISFYSFSKNSLNLFKEALNEFMKTKTNKLVIDLRGNPGGFLNTAVSIASIFVDEGKVIVSEKFEGKDEPDVHRSRGPNIFNKDLKVVVLVDQGSASASEILAGALQQHKVATLVGEKTYGKGTVQELVELTKDTSLKITVAKWLLPNGEPIPSDGLVPDYIVPITDEDNELKHDPQMEKAVEILLKK